MNSREIVEEGIQHVQQNKVNAKNAFELKCIENMDVVLDVLQSDEDFHFAATTIESSAKIYGFRVDNVHAETCKMRGLFENYDDKDDSPDKPARKVRQVSVSATKAAHCKTATELNLMDLDAMGKVEHVDPFFAQMTHQTEKGGDQGLLLNLMPPTKRAGVVFNGQVPMHVDALALDAELESQKMSSESRTFKQVSAMLKEVTAGKGVMAPEHYEYLRECAKEGTFGAENVPTDKTPPSSPSRRSPGGTPNSKTELDSAIPDVAPIVSSADLANIQMELSFDDEPDADFPDLGPINDLSLEDQSEEELAKQELESMAIVEKPVKKKAPKNLAKKDRKPRSRRERKEMRKEHFEALDAEGNIDGSATKFVKGEGGLPPEQGQSAASKVLAEDLDEMWYESLEYHNPEDAPEPEAPLVHDGSDALSEVGQYQELIKAIYKEKNPEKLSEVDKIFEKYDTESKLKKAYDFVCKKYEVTDAPALLHVPAVEHAPAPVFEDPPSPKATHGTPEPAHAMASDPATPGTANQGPSLQDSWLKAKRSSIRVPIVVNALEASVSKRSKDEDIQFSVMMEEARGKLQPREKPQLTVGIAFISLLHLANDQNLELIQGDDCGDFSVNLEKKGTDHHKEQISSVLSSSRKKPAAQSPSLPNTPTATPSSKKPKTDAPKSAKTAGKTAEAPAPSAKKAKVDQPTMTPDNPPPQKKASTPEKTKVVAAKAVPRKK
jgi:hypothetical protein